MPKRKLPDARVAPPDPVQAAALALRQREREALRCYRPGNDAQDRIHKTEALTLVISGANRCLGGEQKIYDPIDNEWKRVDSITGEFHVLAVNPHSGKLEIAAASEPFTKPSDSIYEVEFSNGVTLYCTPSHRIVSREGTWLSVRDAFVLGLPVAAPMNTDYLASAGERQAASFEQEHRFLKAHALQRLATAALLSGSQRLTPAGCFAQSAPAALQDRLGSISEYAQTVRALGASHWNRIQPDSPDRCFVGSRQCDALLHYLTDSDQVFVQRQDDARECSPTHLRSDGLGSTSEHIHPCQSSFLLSTQDVYPRSAGQSFFQKFRTPSTTCLSSDSERQARFRSTCTFASSRSIRREAILDQLQFVSSHAPHVCVAGHVYAYITAMRYLRQDDVFDLTVEGYGNYWTGVVNANSGKSVCGYSEAVSRILGIPILDREGRQIPLRFPVPQPGEQFQYWFVGYDLDHIGQTIYRILFQPGLFYVIQDKVTGQWVTWNETIPDHAERMSERKPAGPLIPSRYIDEKSWTWNPQGGGNSSNCFESVTLKNGAVIRAFPSSTPQAKQGDPVRGILVDEDVKFGQHVPEYMARLGDYGGWFIWPAWPHDENYMLSNLIDGCERAMEEGDPRFELVRLRMSDNPFFSTEKKRLQIDRFSMLGDEEMIASRVEGDRQVEGRRMYEFWPNVHGISSDGILRSVPNLDPRTPRGVIQKLFRTKGKLPDEWTRYLALDPSTTRTAVAFGVVPPPVVEGVEMPPVLIVEDELVLKRATVAHVAQAVGEKISGRVYEAFIIDRRFGQQTHQAAGMATWDIYAQEFAAAGVKSRTTDEYFIPGCDIPHDRATKIRQMLAPPTSYQPQLWVILDNTPQTLKEFSTYYKKKEKIQGVERILDVAENPRKFDCMSALEYLVAHVEPLLKSGVAYIEPEPAETPHSTMKDIFSRILGQVAGRKYIHLGPGQTV